MSAALLFTAAPYGSLCVGDVFLRTVNGTPVAVVVDTIEPDVRHETRRRVTGRVVGTNESCVSRLKVDKLVTCVRGKS